MPDEDEKNLAAVPASDSVPPDAPTVVTEIPTHLIEALAKAGGSNPAGSRGGPSAAALAKAALAHRSAVRRPVSAPDPAPAKAETKPDAPESPGSSPPPSVPTATEPLAIPAFDAQKTVEIPTAIDLLDLQIAGVPKPAVKVEAKSVRPPRPSFDDIVQTAVMDSSALPAPPPFPAEIPAAGPPTFPIIVDEEQEEVELGDDQLEPYESPSDVAAILDASPKETWPAPATVPAPALEPAPVPAPLQAVPSPIDEAVPSLAPTSSVASSFAARRAAMGTAAGKSGPVWAEPPAPAVLVDQPSALGWAIGGILGGVLLLALLVWLLYLGVRHFIS